MSDVSWLLHATLSKKMDPFPGPKKALMKCSAPGWARRVNISILALKCKP